MAAEDYIDFDFESDNTYEDIHGSWSVDRQIYREYGKFDVHSYSGDVIHYPFFGIYRETDLAILFIANQAGTEGFWIPKSLIIEKVNPRTAPRTAIGVSPKRPGRVYVPTFHAQKVISLQSSPPKRTQASEDFKEFAQPSKVPTMDNYASRVKTNHMLSMFQGGYTTVAVEFYGESERVSASSTHRRQKLYTYKIKLPIDLKIGDLVVVPVGDADDFGITEMRLAIVQVIHAAPEIDYDSDIIYRWVIQKLDMTGYNHILEDEKKFRELMVQADKIQHREKLKKAFIELAGDSEAKSLLEQAIQLVSNSAESTDNVLDL